MKMTTGLSALALALGLCSGSAMAAVETATIDLGTVVLPYSFATSKSFMAGTDFVHTWKVTFSQDTQVFASLVDMAIGSYSDISDFKLNGMSLPGDFAMGVTSFSAGTHSLVISGEATGTYGGAYSISMNAVPVPEAETWAMLLAGLGLVGLAMRKQTNARNNSLG